MNPKPAGLVSPYMPLPRVTVTPPTPRACLAACEMVKLISLNFTRTLFTCLALIRQRGKEGSDNGQNEHNVLDERIRQDKWQGIC